MSSYSLQNILVAVDLSDTSLNAIETAVALAKRHNAVLHLCQIREKSAGQYEGAQEPYAYTGVNADVLSAIASAIQHEHEVALNLVDAEGNVADCILKAALQISADLIVMGTHGASGYRDGFIGTNAYTTIKYSTCPVLTIPPGRKMTSFRSVLFPVRPLSGALANYAAVDSFLAANATVDVFGVSHRPDAESNLLDKLIAEIRDQSRWGGVVTQTFWGLLPNAPEAILRHALRSKPDLLIVTSTLDPVAKPDYVGPHAQKIIHSARTPVLVLKKASVPLPV